MWSSDGRRLVVVAADAAHVYSAGGRRTATITLPVRDRAGDAALSPDGRTLALVVNRAQVIAVRLDSTNHPVRQMLAGSGVQNVSWSPDGRWVVVSWPAANQWVFVRVRGAPRVTAVSRIAQQFSPSGSPRSFPQLEGWCCTARGPAG
jgi:dipeptidyl aminopeptidase/acylaminoacyl peptidase